MLYVRTCHCTQPSNWIELHLTILYFLIHQCNALVPTQAFCVCLASVLVDSSQTLEVTIPIVPAAKNSALRHNIIYSILHEPLMQLCCCSFIVLPHTLLYYLLYMISDFWGTTRPTFTSNDTLFPIPIHVNDDNSITIHYYNQGYIHKSSTYVSCQKKGMLFLVVTILSYSIKTFKIQVGPRPSHHSV